MEGRGGIAGTESGKIGSRKRKKLVAEEEMEKEQRNLPEYRNLFSEKSTLRSLELMKHFSNQKFGFRNFQKLIFFRS